MSLRRSPRFIILLILATTLGPLAMQMFLPALPAIQAGFAADPAVAQLTLTLAMLSMGVTTLIFGPLSDRFGRKPVLLVGLVMFLAGCLSAALAPNIALLIVARVLQTGGAAAGVVLARAMARDVFGFAQSVQVISYLTMVMVVAPMASPAVGGIIVDAFGWRAIFWAMTGVAVVVVVGVWAGLAETHPVRAAAGWRDLIEGSRRLLLSRRYVGYTLLVGAATAVFFAFLAAAPYLMAEVLHRPARDYGLWFMPVAGLFMVGTFIATRFVNRYGPDRLIHAGTVANAVIVAVSLLLYYWLPLSVPLLFVPIMLITFVQGFVVPNAQASAINIDPRYVGAASGLIGFIPMLMSAAAAQGVAMLADGTVWPMLAVMAAVGVGAPLCLPLIRRDPNRHETETRAGPPSGG